MSGVLEDVFNVRTNGDRVGSLRSAWDRILLLRDLERLVNEGRVKLLRDVPRTSKYLLPDDSSQAERKVVQDSETGVVYEYVGPYERGGCTFRKLDFESLSPIPPNNQPM